MKLPKDQPTKQKPHYYGHRERLRQRFEKSNGQGLADYELLELLLFHNFVRGDTKPLAKELLHTFKSFNGLCNASKDEVCTHNGAGESVYNLLKIVGTIAKKMTTEAIEKKSLINSLEQVVEYARLNMGFLNHEELRILFLNTKGELIREQTLGIGTINETPIYPREVVRYGLMIGAVNMILIHNHPSGDATPSSEDIEITQTIQKSCQHLELNLIDHVIIGKNEFSSLKKLGKI